MRVQNGTFSPSHFVLIWYMHFLDSILILWWGQYHMGRWNHHTVACQCYCWSGGGDINWVPNWPCMLYNSLWGPSWTLLNSLIQIHLVVFSPATALQGFIQEFFSFTRGWQEVGFFSMQSAYSCMELEPHLYSWAFAEYYYWVAWPRTLSEAYNLCAVYLIKLPKPEWVGIGSLCQWSSHQQQVGGKLVAADWVKSPMNLPPTWTPCSLLLMEGQQWCLSLSD